MKLTNKLLVPAVALALCSISCVPDVVSIQVKRVVADAIDENCVVKTGGTVGKAGGEIDLTYLNPNAPAYYLGLEVISNVEATELTSGGAQYNPASRNDFYISKVKLRYTGDGVPEVTSEMSLAGLVEAGGTATIGMSILSSDAYKRLIAVATPEGREVKVEIKLVGTFAHGEELETAPFMFPLVVYSSGVAPYCDPSVQDAVSAAGINPICGNWGQDGIGWMCVCKEGLADCAEGQVRNLETCLCE